MLKRTFSFWFKRALKPPLFFCSLQKGSVVLFLVILISIFKQNVLINLPSNVVATVELQSICYCLEKSQARVDYLVNKEALPKPYFYVPVDISHFICFVQCRFKWKIVWNILLLDYFLRISWRSVKNVLVTRQPSTVDALKETHGYALTVTFEITSAATT